MSIAYDIWIEIFKYLSIKDLTNCRLTDKNFKNISDDQHTWKFRLLYDFRKQYNNKINNEINYITEYKKLHDSSLRGLKMNKLIDMVKIDILKEFSNNLSRDVLTHSFEKIYREIYNCILHNDECHRQLLYIVYLQILMQSILVGDYKISQNLTVSMNCIYDIFIYFVNTWILQNNGKLLIFCSAGHLYQIKIIHSLDKLVEYLVSNNLDFIYDAYMLTDILICSS